MATSLNTVSTTKEAQVSLAKGEAARKLLINDESPAEAVYEAANYLMTGAAYALDSWAPETVILELERKNIKPSDLNMSKIFCCVALKVNVGVPFTGSTVFKNVCCLFNNELPDIDSEEEIEVEELAWGVRALNLFFKEEDLYFDYGPIDYIADILHMDGYVLAPGPLAFVQEYLTKRNQNCEMEDEVRNAIEGQEKNYNDAVKAQVAKNARVIGYVSVMEGMLVESLSHL